MKILVTGYAGMNGAWTCRELLARGHEVVGVDLSTGTAWERSAGGSFTAVELDITDDEAVDRVIGEHRPDVIAHSAAITAPEGNPRLGLRVNALGSVNVFEAASNHAVRRVVFSSSKAVYGEIHGAHGHPDYVPVDESHPRSPIPGLRIYGATKYLVEEFGRKYAETRGLEFLALRFATIYGPGKVGPVGVISRLIEGSLADDEVRIEVGGDQRDDFIYVKDVANGVADACTAPEPRDWAFNIGSGVAASLSDIVDAVRPHLDHPPAVEIGPGLDYLGIAGLYSVLDSRRAKDQLGFVPRYDLRTGIADYVATLREQTIA